MANKKTKPKDFHLQTTLANGSEYPEETVVLPNVFSLPCRLAPDSLDTKTPESSTSEVKRSPCCALWFKYWYVCVCSWCPNLRRRKRRLFRNMNTRKQFASLDVGGRPTSLFWPIRLAPLTSASEVVCHMAPISAAPWRQKASSITAPGWTELNQTIVFALELLLVVDQKSQNPDVVQEVPHNAAPFQEHGTFDSDRAPEVLVQRGSLGPSQTGPEQAGYEFGWSARQGTTPGTLGYKTCIDKEQKASHTRQPRLEKAAKDSGPSGKQVYPKSLIAASHKRIGALFRNAKVCNKVKINPLLAIPSILAKLLIARKAYFSNLVLNLQAM